MRSGVCQIYLHNFCVTVVKISCCTKQLRTFTNSRRTLPHFTSFCFYTHTCRHYALRTIAAFNKRQQQRHQPTAADASPFTAAAPADASPLRSHVNSIFSRHRFLDNRISDDDGHNDRDDGDSGCRPNGIHRGDADDDGEKAAPQSHHVQQ